MSREVKRIGEEHGGRTLAAGCGAGGGDGEQVVTASTTSHVQLKVDDGQAQSGLQWAAAPWLGGGGHDVPLAVRVDRVAVRVVGAGDVDDRRPRDRHDGRR